MEGSVKHDSPEGKKITKSILNMINLNDQQFLGIIVAVGVIILTLILLKLWVSRKSARRSVLLLGLCDAGKTRIWSQLIHGRHVGTHTSIKENIDDYQTNKGMLKIVDIPGHERLRFRFLDQYKSATRAFIFVVDALTFQKDIRDVAEYLYTVLTDSAVMSANPSVLILAHKQDQPMAKGCALLQANLERELNVLRQTKDKQLDSLSDKENSSSYLGKHGKDFTFAHLNPLRVEFGETSAEDSLGLEPIKKWLASLG
uniref:Signal recognition particle receptor subunit beta n=1 Tax=Franklinothrips vespiformis TaxID=297892 RepID=A0A481SW78_FRAVS|nr:putative ARL3 [Franklinothrips vespiformis]